MNRSRWNAVNHSVITHREAAACFDHSKTTTRAPRIESGSCFPQQHPEPDLGVVQPHAQARPLQTGLDLACLDPILRRMADEGVHPSDEATIL